MLGVDSMETFWLEFWLEKPLEFWLEIPYTMKLFKNGQFRHVSESKWNLKLFFKPKFKPKISLLNWAPAATTRCTSTWSAWSA